MQAIGIHVDGSVLLRAAVRLNRKGIFVESLQSVSRVKPLYTESGTIPLVSGLSSSDLLINTSSIPSSHKSRKIKEAVKMQVQTQTHLPAESLLSVVLLDQKRKKATVYSTTQYALSTHLQELLVFDQDPDRVSVIPEALRAFLCWKAPSLSSYVLIHIGLTTTHCLWVEEGLVQKAATIGCGTQDVSQEDRARFFHSELIRIVSSFQCQRRFVFIGEECREFCTEFVKGSSGEEQGLSLSADERRYAIPLGLAVDYLVNRKDPVQFRKNYSLSERNFFLIGRNVLLLLVLSLVLCSSLLVIGTRLLAHRERDLVEHLVTRAKRDPELYGELYRTGEDPECLVHQWSKMMRSYAKEYPYVSKAPRVSEVLNWLMRKPFVLEKIGYQLTSFPRLEAMKEPYVSQVEIRFKTDDSAFARQWREALFAGESLCDASKEIVWDHQGDEYTVSFFLKNGEPDV